MRYFFIGVSADAGLLILSAEEPHECVGGITSDDRLYQRKIVAGTVENAGHHLPAARIGIALRSSVICPQIEIVVRQKLHDIRVYSLSHGPRHPVFDSRTDIYVSKPAEKRLGKVV